MRDERTQTPFCEPTSSRDFRPRCLTRKSVQQLKQAIGSANCLSFAVRLWK